MTVEEREARLRHFVEEIGLLLQEMGGPPMNGRVLGRLLTCEPAEQSLTELADYLGASKGSISPVARQLVQAGLLTKVPRPGSRATYYRLKDNAWVDIMRTRTTYTKLMREQAERGLTLVEPGSSAHRRVSELVEFYAFFERSLPALLEQWLQSREDA